jgi:hypothetical protein
VIEMQAELRANPNANDELLHPAYWLVHSLDWPGGDLAEAAVAVAPSMIPRDALSWSASQILGCADLYARKRAARVIFFSDLTRMFADAGHSWAQLGVDWEAALRELEDGPFPTMFLTISERGYHFISSPALHMLVIGAKGAEEATEGERDLVRQAIAQQLAADWPSYMRGILDALRARGA